MLALFWEDEVFSDMVHKMMRCFLHPGGPLIEETKKPRFLTNLVDLITRLGDDHDVEELIRASITTPAAAGGAAGGNPLLQMVDVLHHLQNHAGLPVQDGQMQLDLNGDFNQFIANLGHVIGVEEEEEEDEEEEELE